MKIPVKRWEKAIKDRHSSRTYNNQPLPGKMLKSLNSFIDSVNSSFSGVRAVLIKDSGKQVVSSLIGSYGVIKGIRSYIAFIADQQDQHHLEKIGYLGEMCILEPISRGLGTCWISGTFKPEVVEKQIEILDSERVMAITPVGYTKTRKSLVEKLMKKAVGSHKRKPLDELCPEGYQEDWPEWIKTALELARLAPSAINKQPWRFYVSPNLKSIEIRVDDQANIERKRLDCGITMLHIDVAALKYGVKGEWSYLNLPGIARFKKV